MTDEGKAARYGVRSRLKPLSPEKMFDTLKPTYRAIKTGPTRSTFRFVIVAIVRP